MARLIRSAGRYARTVAHLHPMQLVHRVRLRAQRAVLPMVPDGALTRGLAHDAAGWPAGFVPVDERVACGYPDPVANAAGRFTFFGVERDVGRSGWLPADTPRLWRYHLHYFEWAWSFVGHPDREWASREFELLVRRWGDGNPLWRGDPWSPYVVSIRAWVLCAAHDALVRGRGNEGEHVRLLDLHRRHLRLHLELDVGGNHLLKNLKALVGVAVFFGDDDLLRATTKRLERELVVQVLADGGHYELSPSYHCQVLGDLLDVRDLLRAAAAAPPAGLDDAIERMRTWLGWMLLPDGDVPLFNDCVLVGRPRIAVLEPRTPPLPLGGEVHLLASSGYAVLRHPNGLHAVLDVGEPCPPALPAHAHADCLSLQVSLGADRVVLDTGTSTYEAGPRRDHERSTVAHSTVAIDDRDQSEVWGAFRAGRLARARVLHVDTSSVSATHDGYDALPGAPRHVRRVEWVDGALVVVDTIERAAGRATLTWLTSDGVVDGDAVLLNGARLTIVGSPPSQLELDEVDVASDFGRTRTAVRVRLRTTERQQVVRTELRVAG